MSVATLGFQVDSSQAVSATKALNDMTAAAKPAAQAAADLNVASAAGAVGIKASGDAATGAAKAHNGLSTQAMAAQHSIRAMIEGTAQGIPVTQMLGMQLNHLAYAATGPGGITQAFKDAGAGLAKLLPAGTGVFLGLAAVVGTATLALNSYLSAQNKVQASILGAGRASGASSTSINAIASQGASSFGLSTAEARDLASSLAATGKVANDNILPIVKMGHDIAIAFGTDAKGATDVLTQAFADPVKGADQLNQRLGFLDAATKQNISNLVAQNNLYGAQQALMKGVQTSLQGFSDTQDTVTKGWAALGNAASNAWGAIGQFFAQGLGLGQSLEDRLAKAKDDLASLKAMNGVSYLDTNTGQMVGGDSSAVAAQQALVDKLQASYNALTNQTILAQAAQKSFAQQSAVRNLMPEISQQEALNNQLKVLQGLFDSLSSDESAGERLKQLGTTFEIIAAAIAKATSQVTNFKSSYQQALDSQKTQLASITAFSPSAKGDIARQQSMDSTQNSNYSWQQRQVLAQQAYGIAVKQATVALSEQQRQAVLTANQSVASAQLDVTLVGKSVGEQELLKANLASRQQLEQIASQNRTAFNQAEYDQLTKINAKMAEQKQLAAQTAAQDNANYSVQTAFLSDIDQQIASVQRQLHGNAWPQYMNDGLAATMRIADGLKQIHDLGQDVTRGVFTDFETQIRNGASAMDALRTAGVNALGKIADKLAQMAADQLWQKALGGSSGSSLLSLFGIGTGAVNANGSIAGAIGPTSVGGAPLVMSANGNVFPANENGISRYSNQIVNSPTMFAFAKGAGLMGEAGPEAIMPLTRGPNGKLGVVASGGGGGSGAVHVPINVNIDATGADAAGLARVAQSVADLKANLPGMAVQAIQGAKKRRVVGL